MNVRLTALLGVVLGVFGLVALAVPGVATAIPASDLLVTGLGAVLVVGGLRELRRRQTTDQVCAETADVEQAIELPTPGADFDRRLDGLSRLVYRANERNRLREAVADAAVATLRRRRDCTEREARAALRDGTWTDDPYAAAFLSGRAPDVNPLARVRDRIRPDTAFRRRARHAVDELYRIAEGEEGADVSD